jgi:hypothetical protein
MHDVEKDHNAVMSSKEHSHEIRRPGWPKGLALR